MEIGVTIPAHLHHTGEARFEGTQIDRCIAPIVEALNVGLVRTDASCCGHGKGPGEIVLHDGRVLTLARSNGSEPTTQPTSIDIDDDCCTVSLRFGGQAHKIVVNYPRQAIEAVAIMLYEKHAVAAQAQAERDELADALRFYAEPNRYIDYRSCPPTVMADGGSRARTALGKPDDVEAEDG